MLVQDGARSKCTLNHCFWVAIKSVFDGSLSLFCSRHTNLKKHCLFWFCVSFSCCLLWLAATIWFLVRLTFFSLCLFKQLKTCCWTVECVAYFVIVYTLRLMWLFCAFYRVFDIKAVKCCLFGNLLITFIINVCEPNWTNTIESAHIWATTAWKRRIANHKSISTCSSLAHSPPFIHYSIAKWELACGAPYGFLLLFSLIRVVSLIYRLIASLERWI